jgi:hypothetical protein
MNRKMTRTAMGLAAALAAGWLAVSPVRAAQKSESGSRAHGAVTAAPTAKTAVTISAPTRVGPGASAAAVSGAVSTVPGADALQPVPSVIDAQPSVLSAAEGEAAVSEAADGESLASAATALGSAQRAGSLGTGAGREFDRAAVRRGDVTVDASAKADKPLAGRKLLLLGGVKIGDPWILKDAQAYAARTGVEVFLVGTKANRGAIKGLIDDDHFLEADEILDHDPKIMKGAVDKIEAFARAKGFTKDDRVRSYINALMELNGMVVDRLGVFGNSFEVISNAHTKSKFRELSLLDDDLRLPYAVINDHAPKDPADMRAVLKQVREQFKRITAEGKSGKVVLKPIHGGGSTLVFTGIDSPEAAVKAWRKINQGLTDPNFPGLKGYLLDHYPGVMMEYQVVGPEVDVETVRRPDGDEMRMMGNPPMHMDATERGLVVPFQGPAELEQAGYKLAKKALDAVGYKAGNAHVELIYSLADKRWYVLEVNARMGGGPVKQLIKSSTDVDLIWEDLNAHFGLPRLNSLAAPKDRVGVNAFAIAKVSGELVKLDGIETAKAVPGIVADDFWVFKKAGEEFDLREPMDYLAMVNSVGRTYSEAFDTLKRALSRITFTIRAKGDQTYVDDRGRTIKVKDGQLVRQTGAYSQPKIDDMDLYNGGTGRWRKGGAQ